jgi:hypothetical protein
MNHIAGQGLLEVLIQEFPQDQYCRVNYCWALLYSVFLVDYMPSVLVNLDVKFVSLYFDKKSWYDVVLWKPGNGISSCTKAAFSNWAQTSSACCFLFEDQDHVRDNHGVLACFMHMGS